MRVCGPVGLCLLVLAMPGLAAAADDFRTAPTPRGLITARQEAVLSSRMAGRIQAIHRQEGERFAEGERLIDFFCPIRQARLKKARALLAAVDKRLAVQRELVKIRSASRLDLELLEAERLQAEAEVAVSRAESDMCRIQAPFDGRVAEVRAHAHESVPLGQPLLDVVSEGDFEVRVIVPSGRYARIRPGVRFDIHLEETGRHYPVEVLRLGGRIDPVSQTFRVIGRVIGDFPELIPGMSGPVRFADASNPSRSPVPPTAPPSDRRSGTPGGR